jgi:hypothetical protein
MMPTITVDEEVFEYLKGRAEPFVDTPNTVLRRELNLGAPSSTPPASVGGPRRLRRDAAGLGDEERYLRGVMATILVDGKVSKRSGVRSPRGADLNQIQTWVAEVVGNRHQGNARLIHNLRLGSAREAVDNVTVVVEPQDVSDR